MDIFSVGFERSRWLSARVAVIADNVANSDTPGYRAKDLPPFAAQLEAASHDLNRSNAGHLPLGALRGGLEPVPRSERSAKHSGNGIGLETEMAALGDTRAQQLMATGVIGAFHRMLLSSVRG
jgi:flagellar basal-body rod protein FlgB